MLFVHIFFWIAIFFFLLSPMKNGGIHATTVTWRRR